MGQDVNEDQIHTNAVDQWGEIIPERNRTQRKLRRNAGRKWARRRRKKAKAKRKGDD